MHIWAELATFTITVAGSNVFGSNAGSNHDILGATLSLLPPTSCQNDCLPLQNDKSPLKSSQVFPALAEAGHTPRSMEDGVLMRSEWSQSSQVKPYAASTKLLGSLTGQQLPIPTRFPCSEVGSWPHQLLPACVTSHLQDQTTRGALSALSSRMQDIRTSECETNF